MNAPHPAASYPRTRQEAHAYALAWVAHLESHGYDPDQAEREDFTGGGGGKGDAGYTIFDQQIHIKDCYSRGKNKWSFNFRALSKELKAPKQADLF